jgi:hypothetical protein
MTIQKIDKPRPHSYPYYKAQALANLDQYVRIDDDNPPMVKDCEKSFDLKELAE